MKLPRNSEKTALWTFKVPPTGSVQARVGGSLHDLTVVGLEGRLAVHGPAATTPPVGSLLVTASTRTSVRVNDDEVTTGWIYLV